MNAVLHTWKSKWVFILAAVGAAAGLGNLWRFPYMVYENGGAAFVFAYLVCLFVLVIPLMMMEVAFGQMLRKDIVTALGDYAGWFGRFSAWIVVLLLVLLLGYYTPVAGWSIDFLYHSVSLSWGNDAESFFYSDILQITDSPLTFGGFSIPVVIGVAVSYLFVYLSIFKGLESITKVIKWTVTLPFVLLFILLINSLFLPGSMDGFRYLLIPDTSAFFSVMVWRDAASQAFLSANIGLVITILYASFNSEGTNIAHSAIFIALGNAAVSFLSAFAIFGTLGYIAASRGVSLAEVVDSGPTLAFVAFPNALSALPFGRSFFSLLFFLTLFTLAIDTIFAVTEVLSATLRAEFHGLRAMSRERMIGIICLLLFFWSLAFSGGNGLYRLDAMDHAVLAHMLYWGVIPQIIIIGWLVPIRVLREHINAVSGTSIGSWFDGIIRFVAPVFLITLYLSSLPEEFSSHYADYPVTFLTWWYYLPLIAVPIISALLAFRTRHEEVLED